MRISTWRALLGLALIVSIHPARAEVSVGGQLGFSLQQRNDWREASDSSSRIYWFNGGIHLDASFFAPGTLTLGGSADYMGYRASGGGMASDALNYSLRISALGRTPLRLSAAASRSTVDFTSDSSTSRTGSTRADDLSVSAGLFLQDAPYLTASFRTTAVTNRSMGNDPVDTNTAGVIVQAGQAVDWANYRLMYDSNWSSGDYAETNYTNHHLSFESTATLQPQVTARLGATYFLRLPTITSALNPRIDTQIISSWFNWGRSSEAYGGGGYSYSSSLFEVPGEPIRESISHALNASGTRQLNDDFAVDLSAAASAAQTRANLVESQATGEQVGAALRWRRQQDQVSTSASLAGGIGGFQPRGGEATMAWSLSALGGLSRPVSTWMLGASLNASHDSNSGAYAGTRTRILGIGTATGEPMGWSVNSLLNLGYSLADSQTFGTRRQLNARLNANARRGGYLFEFNAGVTDDLAEVLAPGSVPAAGIAPADFNTQSRYAIVSVTLPTIRQLYLTLTGRHLTFTSPGRGTQWETGATLSASYYLGAFQFSLYDQLTTGGGSSSASSTQNLLFFSVTRSFGR